MRSASPYFGTSKCQTEKIRALIFRLLLLSSIFFLFSVLLGARLPLRLGSYWRPGFGFKCLGGIHVPGCVLACAQSTCLRPGAARFHGCCRPLPMRKGFPYKSCLSPLGTGSQGTLYASFVYQGGSCWGNICGRGSWKCRGHSDLGRQHKQLPTRPLPPGRATSIGCATI